MTVRFLFDEYPPQGYEGDRNMTQRQSERISVDLPGVVASLDPDRPAEHAVQLVDLSQRGAALLSVVSLRIGSRWRLHVRGGDGSPDIETDIIVRHSGRDVGGEFQSGVEFVGDAAVSFDQQAGVHASTASGLGPTHNALVISGSLTCRRLADVRCSIAGSLTLGVEASDCRIAVEQEVKAPHATIRGGRLTAGRAVDVRALGDADGTPTEVILGSIPRVQSLLSLIPSYLDDIKKRFDELEDLAARSKKDPGSLSHAERERLTASTFETEQLKEQQLKIKQRRGTLRDQLNAMAEPVLHIQERLFPGVLIRYRSRTLAVNEAVDGPLTISLDDRGELAITRPRREAA